MKKARLILSASMFALMGMSALTFTSCSKDDKVCDAGYEGKDCDVQIRTPMLGTYTATDKDNDDGTIETYTAVITTNSTVSVVNISNFGNFYSNSQLVTSNVTKSGNIINFTIPAQKPDNVYKVEGNGTFDISSKKININYSLDNGISILNYTGVWNMQ